MCCNFTNRAVERRMYKFGVIFVQDLLRDYRRVFALLREICCEKVRLNRQESREKDGFEDCDARPWVKRL